MKINITLDFYETLIFVRSKWHILGVGVKHSFWPNATWRRGTQAYPWGRWPRWSRHESIGRRLGSCKPLGRIWQKPGIESGETNVSVSYVMFHLVLGPRIVRKCSPVTRILTWKITWSWPMHVGGKADCCAVRKSVSLRSCGRSKHQGCVLCKNDRTKWSRDFLHICGALWILWAHLIGSATVKSILS